MLMCTQTFPLAEHLLAYRNRFLCANYLMQPGFLVVIANRQLRQPSNHVLYNDDLQIPTIYAKVDYIAT